MKDDKNVVSGNVTRNDAPHVTGGVNTRLVILLTLSPSPMSRLLLFAAADLEENTRV